MGFERDIYVYIYTSLVPFSTTNHPMYAFGGFVKIALGCVCVGCVM